MPAIITRWKHRRAIRRGSGQRTLRRVLRAIRQEGRADLDYLSRATGCVLDGDDLFVALKPGAWPHA